MRWQQVRRLRAGLGFIGDRRISVRPYLSNQRRGLVLRGYESDDVAPALGYLLSVVSQMSSWSLIRAVSSGGFLAVWDNVGFAKQIVGDLMNWVRDRLGRREMWALLSCPASASGRDCARHGDFASARLEHTHYTGCCQLESGNVRLRALHQNRGDPP